MEFSKRTLFNKFGASLRYLFGLTIVLLYAMGEFAVAQQINLSAGQRPSCSTNNWNVVGNRYHCVGGNASITIPANSVVTANTSAFLYAEAGITVQNGSSVGSAAAPIGLGGRYNSVTVSNSTVVGNLFSSAASFVSTGTVNPASSNIVVTGSSVIGDVRTNGSLTMSGSSLTGAVLVQNASTISDGSTVNGPILVTSGSLSITGNSEVNGNIRSNCCNVTVTDSAVLGNIESGDSNINITNSIFSGAVAITSSNNTIDIKNSEMLAGSLSAWVVTIDNQSDIGSQAPIFLNAQNHLNNGSELNAICNPDYPRCAANAIYLQSQLPMCTDVWRSAQRTGNQFFPEPGYTLPEEALNNPLPQTLAPGDYLRRGDFGDVNANWNITGPTARVYVDGNLTIQRGRRLNVNGPPGNLILVVTGNLTIEPNVQINGYIYVQGNITFTPLNTRCTTFTLGLCVFGSWVKDEPDSSITGGVVTNGSIITPNGTVGGSDRQQAARATPIFTFTQPNRAIQGGRFCLGQPRQELWLQFSDNNWSPSVGSVVDSSPQASSVINTGAGFSFPTGPLSVRAPIPPSFGAAGLDSALVADTSTNFEGTCSYAEFARDDGQFFSTPNNPRIASKGSFTIGTWVYPTSFPGSDLMTIASKDENYEFHITNNGRINWWWNNRSGQVREFTSSFALPLNEWSYVGIRYTPGQQTIFRVNGNTLQTTTNSDNSGILQNQQALLIGADHNFTSRNFDGRIDEFRFIRGALTNNEIIALAQERASECQDLLTLICTSDDFQNANNFNLLWQTNRSSGDFTPQIVNGRLRLNEAVGNQATVASLRRAFPAADNYIELTFEFSAYAGNLLSGSVGGDGVAVVFSDADVVPIPGSYGGSLGYAQRDGSGGGIPGPGFQGGWLGIGLDIYGNFAQASEGRQGGLGLPLSGTRNRVSLRGAEQADYQFIRSSAQLTGMSSSSATPPAPDQYKIIIDSRVANTSIITVFRKRPSDADFVEVVAPFNIYNDLPAQQPAVPDRFRISFTGSTGDAFSIHELDNVEVCALQSQPLGVVLDHVRLSHSGELVSCFTETLNVIGCLNDDCSDQYNGTGELLLQASNGTWENATAINGANATVELTGGAGSATLQYPSGGIAAYTLLDSDPIAVSNNPLRCFIGNILAPNANAVPCQTSFTTAGLAFVNPNNINQLDQRPIVAGTNNTRAIRTVETNTLTGACEARVENQTLPTNLQFSCLNPATCAAGQTVNTNGVVLSANSASTVPLTFNSNGVAELTNFAYTDVGEIRLNANLSIPENTVTEQPAITLSGESLPFVSTPHTLRVLALNSDNTVRNTTDSFIAAGETFSLIIQSENALGDVTPSFGRELSPAAPTAAFIETIFPTAGFPGVLTNGSTFSDNNAPDGSVRSDNVAWSEVGSFTMQAELPGNTYLGVDTTSTLNRPASPIGKFFPAYFKVVNSNVVDACTIGQFSYMDNPDILLNFTVEAQNTGGVITQNYGRNDYTETANVSTIATTGTDTAADSFAARFAYSADAWVNGVLFFNEDNAVFTRRNDNQPDGPFNPVQVGLQISGEPDGRNFLSGDALLNTSEGPSVPLTGQLNLRYGRLVLENIAGPDDEDLAVDLRAQFWNGTQFVTNTDDGCTPFAVANLSIIDNPSGVDTTAGGINGNIDEGLVPFPELVWQAPIAPNNVGEFEFEYSAPPWLQFDWVDADGVPHLSPRAFASFGQYRGNDRIIFWLELR